MKKKVMLIIGLSYLEEQKRGQPEPGKEGCWSFGVAATPVCLFPWLGLGLAAAAVCRAA